MTDPKQEPLLFAEPQPPVHWVIMVATKTWWEGLPNSEDIRDATPDDLRRVGFAPILGIEEERDELRAEVERLKQKKGEEWLHVLAALSEAEHQLAETQAENERLKDERDAARADVEAWKAAEQGLHLMLDTTVVERDELRAEVERLKQEPRASFPDVIENLSAETAAARDERDELRAELQEARAATENQRLHIVTCHDSITKVRQENERLKRDLDALAGVGDRYLTERDEALRKLEAALSLIKQFLDADIEEPELRHGYKDLSSPAASAVASQADLVRCDYGDDCTGHSFPDDRPCGYEPSQAEKDGGTWESNRRTWQQGIGATNAKAVSPPRGSASNVEVSQAKLGRMTCGCRCCASVGRGWEDCPLKVYIPASEASQAEPCEWCTKGYDVDQRGRHWTPGSPDTVVCARRTGFAQTVGAVAAALPVEPDPMRDDWGPGKPMGRNQDSPGGGSASTHQEPSDSASGEPAQPSLGVSDEELGKVAANAWSPTLRIHDARWEAVACAVREAIEAQWDAAWDAHCARHTRDIDARYAELVAAVRCVVDDWDEASLGRLRAALKKVNE